MIWLAPAFTVGGRLNGGRIAPPDRDLTAEISAAVTTPDVFTSY